jgi:hypothetical protein
MAVTYERFTQGLSFREYMEQMQENREKFAQNYVGAELDGGAMTYVCNLNVPLNVLVLTEDWCGDALTYVPVFGRLAECSDCWTLKVFLRDQNLDLADQFLKENKYRAVPVFVFFDEAMRELGHFIERPGSVNQERQALIDQLAAEHPEAIQPGLPYAEQSEAGQRLLAEPMRTLRLESMQRWQRACVEEVVAIVRQIAQEKNAVGAR